MLKKEYGDDRIRTPDLPHVSSLSMPQDQRDKLKKPSETEDYESLWREIQIENNELTKWSFLMGKIKMATVQVRCQSL